MNKIFHSILKPLIFKLKEEDAHNLAIFLLKYNLLLPQNIKELPALRINRLGLEFSSPIGLAAGFDKNAECVSSLLKQGFGSVEVGTVTPKAQNGNEKPRLFRLLEDEAIINRMGFNNKGIDYFTKNLAKRPLFGVVGSNIGKNKETKNAIDDYLICMEKVYEHSDYITINISSPNTPGLRKLQSKENLNKLLKSLTARKKELDDQFDKTLPLIVKIAPDINEKECNEICENIINHKIDGLIVGNTTISRPNIKSDLKNENGGLSGKPLFDISTEILKKIYKITNGQVVLIGTGGISNGDDAYLKIKAGAGLLQLYSALIYNGFNLIPDINQRLNDLLLQDGFKNITQAIGTEAN